MVDDGLRVSKSLQTNIIFSVMAFDIHTGLFKHPFVFKMVQKTENDTGGHTEFWLEFYGTRGYFRQVNGSSFLEDGVHVNVQSYEAYTFWRSVLEENLNKDLRLVYDNREFKIDNYERVNEDRRFYKFSLSVAS